MPNHRVAVVLIEDDEAVRDALAFVLRAAGLAVTSYASAEAFLAARAHTDPHCLIVDVRLPGLSGLDLQQQLAGTDVPIVFITGHGDVPMASQAFRAGAVDFIQKPVDDEALLSAIDRAIAQARLGADERVRRNEVGVRLRSLTAREREVLDLIVAGGTNKTVAAQLRISPRTVEVYRRQAMKKMQVRTLADLVRAVDGVADRSRRRRTANGGPDARPLRKHP